jgi:predicted nucleic acid-binding Zn ribbon protein
VSNDGRRSIRGGWPVKIGELLGPALGSMGPRVWTEARLRKAWVDAVGEQVSSHAQVRRLRGTVLEVSVTSDSWATELTYLASAVIERLNGELGEGTVTQLVVQRRRQQRGSYGSR